LLEAALELVVAVAENDVIGRGNQLPWRLPADLRHFKTLTLGKPVLMGRKTYESIGKALVGRLNIVLSRSPEFSPGDCVVVKNLDDARVAATQSTLMVIGGAEIYRQCLAVASRIHLTLVHAQRHGFRGLAWSGVAGVVARAPRSGRQKCLCLQLHHARPEIERQLRGVSLARISRAARLKSTSSMRETAPAVNSASSCA
jgi:dihydrofolate reductase